MSALGLKIIDESVQAANVWINEVDARTGWEHKQRAYRLLRQVLHVIRDHLSVDEAAQLGAQLPILIRGIYYERWDPSKTPVQERSAEGFVTRVQAAFDTDPLGDAHQAIAAVVATMDAHVSKGEMDDVKRSFSKEIQQLFET
ncbi:DUF2267 domain-containing protein [Roseovarius salinarum]|uniref:DUF2267 domain-containing protein n=1 Tax=Roseovarius salinarum TaxID=1981892 RepID=UPI000C31F0C0|nr:DUF2267 domain-containing protein [Roseovarius salinarum]